MAQNFSAALDLIVTRNVDAVATAVAALKLPSPAYALCLWPAEDPCELSPYPLSVGLDVDRVAALSTQAPASAFRAAWNPAEYRFDEVDLDQPGLRATTGYIAAETTVADSLEKQGVLDPARWVLNKVARQLSEQPPLAPVTSDFLAFVLDHNFADFLLENLRAAAPDRVAETLRAKGLLPDDPSFGEESI